MKLELKSSVSKPYTCQYCGNKFVQEKTLFVHICEQKRRHLAKEEKHVVLGFQTYNRFYQITQNAKQQKTYDDFAKSPYYNAFVKFGSYVSNVNPLYPDHYIDWVVKSGVKLDHWCRDSLYEKYVLELIHTEQMETALKRTVENMQKWADTHNSQWNHYFRYVSTNRATFDIKDGKISPWLLLNCGTGKQLLNSLNDEQLTSIGTVIDPEVWVKKFKKQKSDIDLIKEIVREGDL
jgi:hypothetical protein